jgi:hypothetical protein
MITLAEFNARERNRIAALKMGLLNVACDACGEQLVDSNPDTNLATAPPQIRVHCSSCEWSGYAPATVRKLPSS